MATSSVMWSASSTTSTTGWRRSPRVGITRITPRSAWRPTYAVRAVRQWVRAWRELQAWSKPTLSPDGDAAIVTDTSDLVVVGSPPSSRPLATVEIVIPVYNEEDVVEASVRRLHQFLDAQFPLPWLVTIADNASTDRTWDIACRLATELEGIQAVHLDEKGRGRALRATWLASEAPVVAYMDVDLSTDLDALLPLVAPLVSGHSDVAIGTRLAPGARVVRGTKREVISRGYNLLLKATLRSGFSDAQCGFKAIRTDVARAIVPLVEDQGWFFDTELLVVAEHNGLRIHEVPVDWVDDPDSRVDLVGTIRADLRGIGRMLRRFARGTAVIPDRELAPQERLDVGLFNQFVRFMSIGVVSTVLFAVLYALLADPLGELGGAVVAMLICSVANTAANRRLTFALRGRAGRMRHQVGGLVVNLLPLALTTATVGLLEWAEVESRWTQVVALTAANAIATVVRFVLLRQWVFRPADAVRQKRALAGA